MILERSAADAVKKAIDAAHPVWRQIGIPVRREVAPESPPIIFVEIGGTRYAVAAGSSNAVFGAGHLAANHQWREGGCGCAVRGFWNLLDATGLAEIPGFVHLHRLGIFDGMGGSGPGPEARVHFRNHQPEYSAFFPVTFRRDPESKLYPWHAFRRDLPAPP